MLKLPEPSSSAKLNRICPSPSRAYCASPRCQRHTIWSRMNLWKSARSTEVHVELCVLQPTQERAGQTQRIFHRADLARVGLGNTVRQIAIPARPLAQDKKRGNHGGPQSWGYVTFLGSCVRRSSGACIQKTKPANAANRCVTMHTNDLRNQEDAKAAPQLGACS